MLDNGRTLLMDAALRGNKRMFSFLLKHGANRDLRCFTGRQVSDYIKMEFVGKSKHDKNEMQAMLYKDLLLKLGT